MNLDFIQSNNCLLIVFLFVGFYIIKYQLKYEVLFQLEIKEINMFFLSFFLFCIYTFTCIDHALRFRGYCCSVSQHWNWALCKPSFDPNSINSQ